MLLEDADIKEIEVIDGMVNARGLHKFLRIKTRYDQWFNRLDEKYGFSDNYRVVKSDHSIGIGKMTYHMIEINMAKEISMVTQGERGKQARQYFLACEKHLKDKTKELTTVDILELATNEIRKLQSENKKLEHENINLNLNAISVSTKKEYKWIEEVKKDDIGRSINFYVGKHFLDGDYRSAHRKAKAMYRQATGIELPDRIKSASIGQKQDYLEWLSKL